MTWNDVLWNLLDAVRLRRLTARVALSAGLLGLAAPSSGDAIRPRVPVSPAIEPEAAVRKFKGRYVLRRAANALTVHFAEHRSHSSHSSHASHSSHSSHSSSSHYSGAHSSHFSSSAVPPPLPVAVPPKPIAAPPEPEPILNEKFDTSERLPGRWRIGILATPGETFDPNIALAQGSGELTITPAGSRADPHFSGYVSVQSFDLNAVSIAVQLHRAAAGGVTIFAAAIDAKNWIGFRIEGGHLAMESHTDGRIAKKSTVYSPTQQRFLRLRTSRVAPVAVWETSADSVNWDPQYVETSAIKLNALRLALSAGATKRGATGPAAFGRVVVEGKR